MWAECLAIGDLSQGVTGTRAFRAGSHYPKQEQGVEAHGGILHMGWEALRIAFLLLWPSFDHYTYP